MLTWSVSSLSLDFPSLGQAVEEEEEEEEEEEAEAEAETCK